MSLGVSIFLLVVGAVLTFAVNVTTTGFNLDVLGIILMVAGGFGLLLSLVFWNRLLPWTRRHRPMISTVYDDTGRILDEPPVGRDLP